MSRSHDSPRANATAACPRPSEVRRRPTPQLAGMAVALALACPAAAAAQQQQAPAPKPCAGPEHRQFDFWVGEWNVTLPDGKPAGTNRIERIAGSCGLQETWTAASGGDGRSLNGYVAQDGRWHQIWLGSGGLWMELVGGLRDGAMVMEGQTVGRGGAVIHQRITWTPRPDGRVRQLWEQSLDGGKTWRVGFDGLYTRKQN